MRYFVYILQSVAHGKLYIGQTHNLEQRIEKHNRGYVKSTKPYAPWKILYYSTVDSRAGAIKQERKLKNLKSGKRILEWVKKDSEAKSPVPKNTNL